MLITSYVDESGTGGEPRVMLAALTCRATRWHRFNNLWRKMLKRYAIPFSHISSMERHDKPFEDWTSLRTKNFKLEAVRLLFDECEFGGTTAIDLSLYRESYRNQLDDRTHKDSAYGVCARVMIESLVINMKQYFPGENVMNFVFENSQHYGDVKRVFDDLKAHVPEIGPYLGTITPGEKREFSGLQAADFLASQGRIIEPITEFKSVSPNEGLAASRRINQTHCVINHYAIGQDRIPGILDQARSIALEKRGAKRNRGFRRREGRLAAPPAQ